MQDKIYLLSIDEFLEEPDGMTLMEQAMTKVDAMRREKVAHIRQPKAKAASLGAGLLLQLVVRNYMGIDEAEQKSDSDTLKSEEVEEGPGIHNSLTKCTIRQLLRNITDSIPLEFTHGSNGKPYFKDYPVYFNLSHSGEFVVCAVSQQEMGVDIQVHRDGNTERIAKRYFTAGEIEVLDACEPKQRTQLFFDFWAAKEAYGKYTGEGITESLEKEIPVDRVALQMIHSIPGYSLAVCKGMENPLTEMRML